MTNTYGLIGKKLSHSFSPAYFKKKFEVLGLDAEYLLFELDNISKLPALLNQYPGLKGLNVTIPYKVEVLPFLDELEAGAAQTNSVNTIRISKKDNKTILTGYNTDIIGFELSLQPLVNNHKVNKALVLGTGGSAQSVAFVLKKMGIEFLWVSRNPAEENQIHYSQITKEIICDFHLIIQTTPLGMFPGVEDAPPIPYHLLVKDHLLYDLIYNPSETKFLKQGREQGARIYNGQRMLVIQAEASWAIWKK